MLRCSWTQHQGAALVSSGMRKTEVLAKARAQPGAAQQGHYLANTELLKREGDPVQLGETHSEFTFAAAAGPIFCLQDA